MQAPRFVPGADPSARGLQRRLPARLRAAQGGTSWPPAAASATLCLRQRQRM